jgi:hypothetical protein
VPRPRFREVVVAVRQELSNEAFRTVEFAAARILAGFEAAGLLPAEAHRVYVELTSETEGFSDVEVANVRSTFMAASPALSD